MVDFTQIAKCSRRIVWTLPPARRRVLHVHKHMRVLRTKYGARVLIIFLLRRLYLCSALWPHLLALRLEYRVRMYLLIVVQKMVLRWYSGNITFL